MSKKILLVEDEKNLGITLKEYLEGLSYEVRWTQTIAEAKSSFREITPQVVLMDIGLPDGSGLELAKELRAEKSNFLLIFLSALNDPETKVEGFEVGAEDYITKPFALKELTLRLERAFLLQQEMDSEPEEINIGPLKIWFNRFQVQRADGEVIDLGQKECAILRLLYTHRESVLDREKIIEVVWGKDKFPSNRTVDNYIVKLRRWCESDKAQEVSIQSVRGIGYKLSLK